MHESEKWKWSRSVMSDCSRPHGLQPTRLLCPWDFPGKSTGVGCHCLLLIHFLGGLICLMDLNTFYTLPTHEFVFPNWISHLNSMYILMTCWRTLNVERLSKNWICLRLSSSVASLICSSFIFYHLSQCYLHSSSSYPFPLMPTSSPSSDHAGFNLITLHCSPPLCSDHHNFSPRL